MKRAILRRIVQVLGVILPNSFFRGWTGDPQIYQGELKAIVAPILNCYACPSAVVSCPVGSTQHFLAIKAFPYYVLGLVGAVGVLFGRAVCGWVCPFGFLQDLEFKLGRKIKLPHIKLPKWFGYGKFVFLIAFVIIAPIATIQPIIDDDTGQPMTYEDPETGKTKEVFEPGVTWFCKLCPQGALQGGIPQVLINPELKGLLGRNYKMKMIILGVLLIAFLITKRPFCRGMCPLGAFLGLFNGISLLQFHVDSSKCNECRLCTYDCPTEHDIYKSPAGHECIRCGNCLDACRRGAVSVNTIFVSQKESPIETPETA
ncbi:MAG TPA: 4Fe-4S binding protein [candidate division Zixibacteria bacterium]|nr:4Fe-4S binding protein [candidate division Zixibacteria bacterium]